MSSLFLHWLRLEADTPQQVLKARVIAQAVKGRIKFDFKGQRVAFISRFL